MLLAQFVVGGRKGEREERKEYHKPVLISTCVFISIMRSLTIKRMKRERERDFLGLKLLLDTFIFNINNCSAF